MESCFAWLHFCNLFSFEVSANVMTMACTTPKRNGLVYEILLPRWSSLVQWSKDRALGEAGRKFALRKRRTVSHYAVDGDYACRAEQEPSGEAALAELYQLYWSPLYAFARYRGYSPQDAQDLTQGFFLHVIEHETLTRADPLKGKFRSFLLGSFQKYLSVDAQRARCVKRGGKGEFVSLDMQDAEVCLLAQPAENLTPEKLFDAQWAMTLLGRARARLHAEYTNRGNLSTFDVLKIL